MHVFEMVVLVVAIGVIGGVLNRYLKYKSTKIAGNIDNCISRTDFQTHLRKMDILEERVRNLERIATDKGINLADEIEKLK